MSTTRYNWASEHPRFAMDLNGDGDNTMKRIHALWLLLMLLIASLPATALADEVTDWNAHMLQAFITGNVVGVLPTRHAAIVQSAVYDAVNGIERRYEPIRVQPDAAPGASRRAAAVQAAYASLLKLFPAQQADLDAKRQDSLAGIASQNAAENSQSIARGIEWGQKVADGIWAWRSTDGFAPTPPANTGGMLPGQWRPTPPGFASFALV